MAAQLQRLERRQPIEVPGRERHAPKVRSGAGALDLAAVAEPPCEVEGAIGGLGRVLGDVGGDLAGVVGGEVDDVQLGAPSHRCAHAVADRCDRDRVSERGDQELGGEPLRRRARRSVGAVCAHDDVEVHEAAALVLGDPEMVDLGDGSELLHGEALRSGEVSLDTLDRAVP